MNADNQRTPAAERLQNQAIDTVNTEEAEQQAGPKLHQAPTGTALTVTGELFMAGQNFQELASRKMSVSHGTNMTVTTENIIERNETTGKERKRQKVTIIHRTANATTKFTINDASFFKPALFQLFVLCCIKMNEQGLANGSLKRDYISFPLQELLDLGLYTTQKGAKLGFEAVGEALIGTTIHMESKYLNGGGVMFTNWRIKKGQCMLFPNQNADWRVFAPFYTVIPDYFFRLSDRAAALLNLIFTQARQNHDRIAAGKPFSISNWAIHERLMLPGIKGNTRPKQTIKDPISRAIEEIETAHTAIFGEKSMDLLPYCGNWTDPEEAPIGEYMNNGGLQVTISGNLAMKFTTIAERQTKTIKAAQKRKEHITDEAKIRNLQKTMKAEEKAKKESEK